jgi:hypothetical protein
MLRSLRAWVLSAAVLAAAGAAVLYLFVLPGAEREPAGSGPPAAPSQEGSPFGELFRTPSKERLEQLENPYWLGRSLAGFPALLRHEPGNVERAVFAYTEPGDANTPYVLVRVLDPAPFPGNVPSAGSTLAAEFARLRRFRSKAGPAAVAPPNRLLVRPDERTLIEITLLGNPNGKLPPLKRLADLLVAAR